MLPKSTFCWVELQLEFSQSFEQLFQVYHMIVLTLGFFYHVVHIYFNLLVHHVMEQCHHCPLICCPNILQPKRHDLVIEGSPHRQECGLFHIFWSHSDLVIAQECIHKGKQGVFGRIIY